MEGEEAARQTFRGRKKQCVTASEAHVPRRSCAFGDLTHLKVLVVVRIDAEAGDEAVHHELHVHVLAARDPPERLGGVKQQRLVGQEGVTFMVRSSFSDPESSSSPVYGLRSR